MKTEETNRRCCEDAGDLVDVAMVFGEWMVMDVQ